MIHWSVSAEASSFATLTPRVWYMASNEKPSLGPLLTADPPAPEVRSLPAVVES